MLVYNFPVGWYGLILVGIVLWLIFWKLGKTKIKNNIKFGILLFLVCILVEIIGINANLWNYTRGNWPVVLWPSYFVYGMLGYSLIKTGEKYRILK